MSPNPNRMNERFACRYSPVRVLLYCSMLFVIVPGSAFAADLNFAHGLYRQQRYALAAEEYEAFLRSNPPADKVDEARFFTGECYVQTKEDAKALPHFEHVARPQNKSYQYYKLAIFRSGQLWFNLRQYPKASPYLARYIQEFPQDEHVAHAAYYLGEVHLEAGRIEDAQRAFEQASRGKTTPELTTNIQFSRAKLAEKAGNGDAAAQIYAQVGGQNNHPLADDALLAAGAIYFQQRAFDKAQSAFQQLIRRFPQSELVDTARLNEGLSLAQLGKNAEAESLFRQITQATPKDAQAQALAAEAWYRLGLSYLNQQNHARAAETFREALQRYGKSPQAVEMAFHLALAQLNAKDYPSARTGFLQFAQANPKHELADRALHYAARSALELKDIPGAQSAFDQLAASFPNSEWRDRTAVIVAETYLADRNRKDRAALVRRFLDQTKHPESRLRLQYYLATLLFDEQQYEPAAQAVQQLLAGNPPADLQRESQYLLGVSLTKLKRWNDAVAPLETYLASSSESPLAPAAIRNLGEALANLTDAKRARESLIRLLDRVEKRSDAMELMSVLADQQYGRGQFVLAGGVYERLLDLNPQGLLRAKTQVGIGWCWYETKQLEAALSSFQDASQIKHDDQVVAADAFYMMGVCAQQLNRTQVAVPAFLAVFTRYPHYERQSDAGFRAADLLVKAKDFAAADKLYAQLADRLKDSPQLARALYERAWAALDSQAADRAYQYFFDLTKSRPDSEYTGEAYLKLAELAHQQAKYEEADRFTREMERVKFDPKFRPAMLYRRGLAAYKLGKTDQAAEAFQVVAQQHAADPLASASFFWLGEIQFDKGQTDAAQATFQALLGRPDGTKYHPVARLRLSQCLLQAKKWSEAYNEAGRFLADAQDPVLRGEALFVQGRALLQQARFDEARSLFTQVIGPQRTELAAKAQFMIAESHFHQRNYQEALKEFLKVEILYAFPRWQAMALLEIGKCHEQLNERENAQRAYRKVVEQYPNTEESKAAQGRLASLGA